MLKILLGLTSLSTIYFCWNLYTTNKNDESIESLRQIDKDILERIAELSKRINNLKEKMDILKENKDLDIKMVKDQLNREIDTLIRIMADVDNKIEKILLDQEYTHE